MGKIHVLFKKEEIEGQKLDDKIAVVFDILLATTTITAVLEAGARSVIPVLNGKEAEEKTRKYEAGSYLVAGEYEGRTIDGFHSPYPTELKQIASGKTVILSTTNGTVAIQKAANAKQIYAASLLNANAVAENISEYYGNKTIILICSGSSNEFNVEDFYGVGCFIDALLTEADDSFELTDAAYTAYQFYKRHATASEQVLTDSRIGQKLVGNGREAEVAYVAQQNVSRVVPIVKEGRIVLQNEGTGGE